MCIENRGIEVSSVELLESADHKSINWSLGPFYVLTHVRCDRHLCFVSSSYKTRSTSFQIVQEEEEIFKTLLHHRPEQCVSMLLEWFSPFLILFALGPSTKVFSEAQPNNQVSAFRSLWAAAALSCRSQTTWYVWAPPWAPPSSC